MTEQEWLVSTDPQAMLEWLTYDTMTRNWRSKTSDRKLRLFACACCREIWEHLLDEHSRNAVEVAESFADGVATDKELTVAWAAAWYAASYAAWAAAWNAAWYAASYAASYAATYAARNAARAKQCKILRDIVGDPFNPCVVAQITPTVRALAETAYHERTTIGQLDPDRLAVLSDALEESGCENADVLMTLRDANTPKYRGFWVLDVLLGKE